MAKVVLTLEDSETEGDLNITLQSEPEFPIDVSETPTNAQTFGLSAMAHLLTLLEQYGTIKRSYLG